MFDFRRSKTKRWATGLGGTPQTYMLILAAAFILGFLVYARWAVNQLKEYERTASEIFAKAHEFVVTKRVLNDRVLSDETVFIFDEVVQKELFPVIVTDADGNIQAWEGTPHIETRFKITEQALENLKSEGVPDDVLEALAYIKNREFPEWQGFEETVIKTIGKELTHKFESLLTKYANMERERLRELMRKMDKRHAPIPIRISASDIDEISPYTPVIPDEDSMVIAHLHYGESSMINRLTWMPYVEMLGVGFLALIGWLGFRNIKNSEQQHIWVGIAKETAHQLGTPISSLLGWLELIKTHLKENGGRRNGETTRKLSQVLMEMESDTQRLSKIASRFSQIGSIPELRSESMSDIVAETIRYFNKRLPHLGRDIQISEHYGNVPDILVNRELLGWAFENLFKNAVDAIDHKGGLIVVSVRKSSDGKFVNVYITDNGRGMDQKRKRMIFRPGYTTKGRGWGLGLNFVKRIVEGYHGGKVVVQESAPKEGTTVKVMLPIHEEKEQSEGSEGRALSVEAGSHAEKVAQA